LSYFTKKPNEFGQWKKIRFLLVGILRQKHYTWMKNLGIKGLKI
jgi:hypothetical protein